MLVIGAIASDGGGGQCGVENGSREGRVERDLASASLLLFVVVVVVCCCSSCFSTRNQTEHTMASAQLPPY